MILSDNDYNEHLTIIKASHEAISDIVSNLSDKYIKNKADSDEKNIFTVFVASQIYYFAMVSQHKTSEAGNVLSSFIECMPWIPEQKMSVRFEEYLPLFSNGLSGKSPTPFYSLAMAFLEKLSGFSLNTSVQIELCMFLATTIEPAILQTSVILKKEKKAGGFQSSGAHISLKDENNDIDFHAKRFVGLQQNQKGGCLTLILCALLFSLLLFVLFV